ncbi:MAG TPA: hypothetical protein VKB52_00340 [Rhodanobacteraceae bacterium]|nr:hypothetical protein [Rhodanobacteraceae bacterium]
MTTPTTTPNTYPIDLGLKDTTAEIIVFDDTITPDARNYGNAFTVNAPHTNEATACRVTGTGTVNRIPVKFSIDLKWTAPYDRESESYDRTRKVLTWTGGGYSQVSRADSTSWNDAAPDGARRKVIDAAQIAAAAWLKACPQAVRAARLTRLQHDAERAASEVAELRDKLAAAERAQTVAEATAAAWDNGEPVCYMVHVYEPAGWGNARKFERGYRIEAHTPYAAAMAGFERAEREEPAEQYARRMATASPIIAGLGVVDTQERASA